MDNEYPTGTFAVGILDTGHGNKRSVRLIRSNNGWHFVPVNEVFPSGFVADIEPYPQLTDVAPLVAINLDVISKNATPADLARDLRECNWPAIADQIEAQTKPPRIPEPGLWGVVFVRGRGEFVNVGPGWLSVDEGGVVREWATLRDPVRLRPGMEDPS